VPAHELEVRVTEKIGAFLKSDAEVFDGLSAEDESPAAIRNLVVAAKKVAARLPSLPLNDLRRLLAVFLNRVIIRESNIHVLISRPELRKFLERGEGVVDGSLPGARKAVDANDLISLTIEAKRKRCGSEVHLVVPPNSDVSAGLPKQSLIKAIVRAHGWYEQVVQGEALDMRSLARRAGLTERYVGKVFACALLAPDIVQSILDGRQPPDLNFEKLSKHIPILWSEQRIQFGFPSKQSTSNVQSEKSPTCKIPVSMK
jgi:hypothetical protein